MNEMAKRGRRRDGVNKSELIRATKDKLGPRSRPRDVIAALSEQGIHVSRALVTNVLNRAGGKTVSAKAKAPSAPAAPRGRRPAASGAVSMSDLLAAKKIVAEMGSIANARRALDAYEKLL
jgi:hypothetical protein